jgi:hypothetical protein
MIIYNAIMAVVNHQKEAEAALSAGNKTMFEQIHKSAPHDYNWNWVMLTDAAIRPNQQELLAYILLLTPTNTKHQWDYLASRTIDMNNISMLRFLMSQAKNHIWNWDILIGATVMNGDKAMFDYIRGILPPNYKLKWSEYATSYLARNNRPMFEYMRTLAPHDCVWNWQELVRSTVYWGSHELFDYVQFMAGEYTYDWNKLIMPASANGDKPMFRYVFMKAPIDYKWDWNYLMANCYFDMRDYLRFMAQTVGH